MAFQALLFIATLWKVQAKPSFVLNASSNSYLQIGDGSAVEFEFPEKSKGVIIVNSWYREQPTGPQPALLVSSLDTDVLLVENVSRSRESFGNYIVAIRSGSAGLAQLLIQLWDTQEAQLVLLEERKDFRIRVSPVEENENYLGLGHFSENPLLYVLLPLIFINKCAFGCKVELEVLRALPKQPQPLLLGVLGQFVVMPFYGYLLSLLLSLPRALALGLIISCSSPGGGGGYLYSLLLGGDVTLAISMTLISTLAATVLMPLSCALYSHLLQVHQTLHVPFLKILVTLLFIAVPISTGMLIKCHLPRLSRLLLLLIKPFSFLLILGGVIMAYRMGAAILWGVQASIVLAGVSVPLMGLLLGLGLASCLQLPQPQRRTVSIEIGVQNSLLALAVLQLSLQRAQADFASQAPFIVTLSSTSEMLLLVILHLLYKRLWSSP
uniref:P3 protein n=1 Tax=Geotrypetes seraphini TaxID=260995 RepID=A0A6P8NJ42_GEOSA|nr:P3 protein [Geotrypetes seraphini]XP_033775932.1 P3 protein [Geotrypetes seraphini]XP_033775943.1 P3 protein [Geotrypetes seraphini]XP_033775952.1 P3 protein [Geotrypetes seraphini]XP_033775962.1 P3 protein [Geotrypetes seraphini]